ncbi:5728_t:CDS:1, partial [Gigaspora margarita]
EAKVEKDNKNSLLVEDSDASFAPTNIYQDRIGVTRDQQKKNNKHAILPQSIELQEQGRNREIWSDA